MSLKAAAYALLSLSLGVSTVLAAIATEAPRAGLEFLKLRSVSYAVARLLVVVGAIAVIVAVVGIAILFVLVDVMLALTAVVVVALLVHILTLILVLARP